MPVRLKIFALSFFIVIKISVLSLSASGGVLADSSSPLHVIRTEYFDIIFPEECRSTAQKIEKVCDDYYLEITSILETEAYQRFPVTITPCVELLNAYYTPLPYNRIVLYDTLPETSLDMYENTIESIFYHELTHAVTYNMKSDRLKKLSFISDALNPAWLSITTFWAEGATVSFESKGRGGRLNDPFFTQIVNQSVIEKNFPSWRDVTGARDIYPGGTDAYMFGSMFASYLQETYGMSKYADFWKNAGTSTSFSFVAGVFKKTYGIKISSVWKDFENTLSLPYEEKMAALLSHKKSRISSFDAFFDRQNNEVKIAYYDTASSSLRLLKLDVDGKIKKNKKLLAITGITRVSFSTDGNTLYLNRYIDKKNYKLIYASYDIKKGKYREQKNSNFTGNYFSENEIPFSPIKIEENLNAAIIKDGLSWKIRLFDENEALFEYDFSDINGRNLIIHNLHKVSSDSKTILLSFSWAELGKGGQMLSRAGLLKINRTANTGVCFLQTQNAFAGIVDSIPEKGSEDSISFYAVLSEYEKTPLYRLVLKKSDFEQTALNSISLLSDKNLDEEESLSEELTVEEDLTDKDSHLEISYNPFRYYKRGIFLPLLSYAPVYNHDFNQDTSTLLGLTFFSSNPWGDRQFIFSGGYNPIYEIGGGEISFSGGDDSFRYSATGTCIFDKDAFMQTFENLTLAKVLWRGKVSSFSVGNITNFLYGRQLISEDEEDDSLKDNWDDSVGKSLDSTFYVNFSNIHKISPSFYNYAGFSFMPFILGSYRTSENLEKLSAEEKYINAGSQLELRFPILFPFIFTATLYPSSKYVASGSVKAILVNYEIHKGIPALSIFAQRLVLSTTYTGKISYNYLDYEEKWNIRYTDEIIKNIKKEDYSDSVQLSLDLYLSPNTGFIATGDFQFSLSNSLIYRPNPKENEKRLGYKFAVGMSY